LSDVSTKTAMREIEREILVKIPRLYVRDYLRQIAVESLSGVKLIRGELAQEYGDIAIIGKGTGRNPDLCGTVQPDYIALPTNSKEPVIVETKNSSRRNPEDMFQARFYNGVAEKYGIYLLEERLEDRKPVLSPKLIRSKAETVLIYPRLRRLEIVRDGFSPDQKTIRAVWTAKELGLRGFSPETHCKQKCLHHKYKFELPEEDMEPLPPIPLLFSIGMLDDKYDLDMHYQTAYAWKMLPRPARIAIMSERLDSRRAEKLKSWLVDVVGISKEAADVTVDFEKSLKFSETRPDSQDLLKSLRGELEEWQRILKKGRLKRAAPSILGRANSLYTLPQGSSDFVNGARKRWK